MHCSNSTIAQSLSADNQRASLEGKKNSDCEFEPGLTISCNPGNQKRQLYKPLILSFSQKKRKKERYDNSWEKTFATYPRIS